MTANADGLAAFCIQPDDPSRTAYFASGFDANQQVTGWLVGSNTAFQRPNISSCRLVSSRIVSAYTGKTFEDQGLIYVKMFPPDWTERYEPGHGLPIDFNEPTQVDTFVPQKEGFEAAFLPLDARSRTYAPIRDFLPLNRVEAQLLARERDKWPTLMAFVVGAEPNTAYNSIELICNWEVQPEVGTLLARAAPTNPPEDAAAIDQLEVVSTAIESGPGPVASRLATTAAGSLSQWFINSLSKGSKVLKALAPLGQLFGGPLAKAISGTGGTFDSSLFSTILGKSIEPYGSYMDSPPVDLMRLRGLDPPEGPRTFCAPISMDLDDDPPHVATMCTPGDTPLRLRTPEYNSDAPFTPSTSTPLAGEYVYVNGEDGASLVKRRIKKFQTS